MALALEHDVDRTFGNKQFSFYHPVTLGSFVIWCWASTPGQVSDNSQKTYGLTIFEDGSPILNPHLDFRLQPLFVGRNNIDVGEWNSCGLRRERLREILYLLSKGSYVY